MGSAVRDNHATRELLVIDSHADGFNFSESSARYPNLTHLTAEQVFLRCVYNFLRR